MGFKYTKHLVSIRRIYFNLILDSYQPKFYSKNEYYIILNHSINNNYKKNKIETYLALVILKIKISIFTYFIF